MPRNGSGSYSAPANSFNPAVSSTTIASADWNSVLADIETALSESIARDGQTTITANLPMAGNRHTGVGNATARNDYAAAGQVQDSAFLWGGTATGTDAITFNLTPAISAYAAGQTFRFISAGANTTSVTLNVNSLGAKAVNKRGGTALIAGDIPAGAIVEVTYDGTDFELTNNQPLVSAYGATLIDDADAAAARATLGAQTDVITTRGDFIRGSSGGIAERVALGANDEFIGSDGTDLISRTVPLPRGYLAGLGLTNNGTDAAHDIDVAVGVTRDSTNANNIVLSSALTKQIDASWAAGTNQGGLDGTESVAGTPDADTWYNLHAILNPTSGAVDVLFSENATSPTLPSGYTKFRRLGAVLTDGSANIIAFAQDGDYFQWNATLTDYAVTNPGVAAVLRTIATPGGVNVLAHLSIQQTDPTATAIIWQLLSDPNVSDQTPDNVIHTVWTNSGVPQNGVQALVRTNTSSQIRTRVDTSPTDLVIRCGTIGWFDRRGRDD